jgi:hypothetical protein
MKLHKSAILVSYYEVALVCEDYRINYSWKLHTSSKTFKESEMHKFIRLPIQRNRSNMPPKCQTRSCILFNNNKYEIHNLLS